ncbi:MAG: TetR/AcrR family transcriptional regulator [Deferribacteres bacterium]|nr:TetR/AcrR family transcriptional regulator [candidate division KSB1 bacterium]MCB9503545.1 TetR/AcrR family transcriptional regulator [Deferribacteres bacterium]
MAKKNIEETIINAAAKIFLEKGMDGARMQEIAKAAGINQAGLHYYFRSKERLFNTVMKKRVRAFFRSFAETLPQADDFETFLKSFIENYLDHINKHVLFMRFVIWEVQRGAPIMSEAMKEAVDGGDLPLNMFLEKIKIAQEAGIVRVVDPTQFMITTVSACIFPFIARPVLENVFQFSVTGNEFLRMRKEEIYRVLWNGIKKQ